MSDPEGPYIVYGDDRATFVRRCQNCNRFVKADKEIFFNEITGLRKGPNATCRQCGRTEMGFIGFI